MSAAHSLPRFPTSLRSPTALRSMTGYAAATAQHDGFTVTVSLRSVNHRYFDLRAHFPEALLPLEREARSVIQAKNPRGHVDLKVAIEYAGGGDVVVDETLARKYIEIFQRLSSELGLAPQMDVAALSQMPGVIARKGAAEAAAISSEMQAAFRRALDQAVLQWDTMRAEEAALLAQDLASRIGEVGRATAEVERWLQTTLKEAQAKLGERLLALAAPSGLDPARLAQEALLLADRTDPTEEIQRMKAHVQRFGALLEGEADAGRKLDFLLQEMQREANTLLAKVSGLGQTSLAITDLGLQMKAEVEKLREQVQNLQ